MAAKTFTWSNATDSTRLLITKDGVTKVITQNETFTMDMTDDGTTAHFNGLTTNADISLTDGTVIYFMAAPYSYMNVTADGSAVTRAGSIWFRFEQDDDLVEYLIDSVTLDDADAPTTCTMIVSLADSPQFQMTWTITVA